MLEQLKGEHCTCGLDNFCISAKFCRAKTSEIPQKAMTRGAYRVNDRGLPKCVIMKEQTIEASKSLARGSVKAISLKSDSVVKDMF